MTKAKTGPASLTVTGLTAGKSYRCTVFATNSVESDAWDFLGEGFVLGIPINAAALIVVLLAGHIFLSRSRYGWH